MPSSWQSQKRPVNARSVPPRRSTSYCSGESSARHSASVFVISVAMPPGYAVTIPRMAGEVRFGYKASAEQFGPVELLELSAHAEAHGFDAVAVSDHFQPWRHHGGHSPAVLPWLGALGARTERAWFGTSVLTPTLRYQPAVVAQAFA